MYFLLFLFLILVFFTLLLFLSPAVISFIFDTDNDDMHVSGYWLYPFLKASVKINQNLPVLSVFVFHRRIYHKPIIRKKKKHSARNYRSLDLSDTYLTANYGLSSPFATGTVCSIISMVQSYFDIESISQYPDFIPNKEYVVVKAGAKLWIGKTILHFLHILFLGFRKKRRENFGSI